MTGTGRAGGVVVWLTAQAVAFGVMAALLGIVANALFLDAYGSGPLPLTYIAIGVAGLVVSGAVARAARSADLVRITLVVLGVAAAALAASWAIAAVGGGAWVSIPLLVGFPILIQLGFVFLGGQAGRLLDIAGIKASFPRIVAGFPAGAVVGGLIGGVLVGLTGRTEDLLLATAIAQASFVVLVWLTGRRFADRLRPAEVSTKPSGAPPPEREPGATPSMRSLFASRFVLLILGYQVLSALASQLADFLVFDRAAAQYPVAADLAGFLSVYTAVMNVVSIAFLFAVAGPLLRRYGLRLGIAANPLVLTIFAAAMVVANAVAGGGSMALLWVVSAARIADIALTDGTTRTSINATYQVLPERTRLAVQAAVEGIGVPVAIGISGVLIIVLDLLPAALEATIAATTLTCLVWTWSAVLLYRAYGPALVDALRRRRWLDPEATLEATASDAEGVRRLLADTDPRAARLAFDILGAAAGSTLVEDLAALVDDPRPDVRMTALAGLASMGDTTARGRLSAEVAAMRDSPDAADRRRAALALVVLAPADREAAAPLFDDEDPAVRAAVLDAVRPDDTFAVEQVVSALGDPRTIGPAAAAVGRLGDDVVPVLSERLAAGAASPDATLPRLVRAAATPTPPRDEVLRRHVAAADRDLGLIVIERLVGPDPASPTVADALDAVLADDARHAARIAAAALAIDGDARDGDTSLRGALEDEWELVRRRIAAGRLARHGSARLAPALTGLTLDGPAGALAVEALSVLLDPAERERALPVLQPDLTKHERIARLGPPHHGPGGADGWLRDLIEDRNEEWRSPWLRACAIHAAVERGVVDEMDLAAARDIGDPVVDEELRIADLAAG